MIALAIALFVAVVATGPDGIEWVEQRRRRRDRVSARVVYLPSAVCRGPATRVPCDVPCAICEATGTTFAATVTGANLPR